MNLKNILQLTAGGLVLLALGLGLGYYYAPTKLKIEEKIVEKIVKIKDTKTTKKYDPKTGKLIEETNEVKEKETSTEKTAKTTEKSKEQKQFAVKGGVAINPRNLSEKLTPRIGVETRLPLFDSFLGVEADFNLSRPLVGAYVRVGF